MPTKITLLSLAIGAALVAGSAVAGAEHRAQITKAEVLAAQQAWGEALIQISRDYKEGGFDQAHATAEAVLKAAYAFQHGPVLFKPTLTSGERTFRLSHEGALAYFVGGNANFPDSGFALKGWKAFDFNNAGVHINDDMAITMGNVMLTDANGKVTTVDKTWGFQRFDDGDLRIVLHHSSLAFEGG